MTQWTTNNQHENFTMEEWRLEVANGDTVLGYDEWVEHQIARMLAVDDEPEVKTFSVYISCFEDAIDHESAAKQFWIGLKNTEIPPTITVFPDDDDNSVMEFQFDEPIHGDWIVQQREEYVDIRRPGKPGTIAIRAEVEGFVVDLWDEQDTPEIQGTVSVFYEDLEKEEPHYDNPIL